MVAVLAREEVKAVNPLDLVEQIAGANEWYAHRMSDGELALEVEGKWSDYRLHFSWRDDMHALHLSCAFDMRVPEHRRRPVHDLLARANEKMWLGHFDLWSDEGLPMFRHSVPLRGQATASIEQLEDLIEVAIAECERFYPAFQYVVWAGKTAADAVEAALLETVGEA